MVIRRIFGILFILAASAGIVLGWFGIIGIWRYKPTITTSVNDTLALVDETLSTADAGLTMLDSAVVTVTADIASLQSGMDALTKVLGDAGPMLDTVVKMTSKDLPALINTTQAGLASFQNSAQLVDNVLAALTSVPFSPITPYVPKTPLHVTLSNISAGLETVKKSISNLNTGMQDTKKSLKTVETELTKIEETINDFSGMLSEAGSMIDTFQGEVSQFKMRIATVHASAPAAITTFTLMVTVAAILFVISQIGLLVQGVDLLQWHIFKARKHGNIDGPVVQVSDALD